MALPKWTEERTEALVNFVGDESPVSQATVAEAAESLETTNRSISSKLRKMGYEVELASARAHRAFSEDEEATLEAFVTDNSGDYTYAEIADAFADGKFSPKQIQGKILSMELTDHVKPAPKQERPRTFTEAEEATIVEMCADGAYLEDIAEAVGREMNVVRGKALSLLRAEVIASVPRQKNVKSANRKDAFDGLDIPNLTVEEIADQIEKTPRGVRAMLTHRGLTAKDYDGAARKAKAQAAAAAA
jgi:hypothetical protein